jgi:non-specific protein-tyrosine kinase
MQAPSIDDQNTNSIDLLRYLVLLWHWAWLILLALMIAAAGTFYVSKIVPPVYQAKTTVLVDMAASSTSADYGLGLQNSQITQTYSQMVIKAPVLDEVAQSLGIDKLDPKTISSKPVANTQLITVLVEDHDPSLAAAIANKIVDVFTNQVSSLQSARFSASKSNLELQMADIEAKIKVTNEQLASETDQTEKDRLQAMVANYSQTYAGLLQSYEQVRLAEAQTLSSIVQIEPAVPPLDPIRPNLALNLAIAVLVTGLLACALVIIIDILNDKVKTPEEVTEKLDLPVLGVISHYHYKNGSPITQAQPLSPSAEAFRTLRTNIRYAGATSNRVLKTIIVTSAMPGEGKTEILINLGIVLAQNKQRVLLVDADLRRSMLHKRLGIDNFIGLSQLFIHPDLGIGYYLQSTKIDGLSVLTAGGTPPNPSELLGTPIMGALLKTLREKFDFVLIDTPPVLAVTDAAVLAPRVDGLIMVVKPGATSMIPLRQAINQFRQSKANLLGVVLNDVNLRDSSYGYYYRHYKYYDGSRRSKSKKNAKKKVPEAVLKS